MNTGFKVGDAMTKEPVSVLSGATALECSKMMKKEHVGNVLVVEKNKILGIITEQDLIYKVLAEKKDPKKVMAEEIMTKEVITIAPDADITDAMLRMSELEVRRLPVIEEGLLVGILTLNDILKIEPELFELFVEKIELREEDSKPINKVFDKEGVCQSCGNYASFLFERDGTLVCKNCRN